MIYPATWLVLLVIAAVILIWASFILWGWRSGQFEDIESAKYRMLEEEETPKQ